MIYLIEFLLLSIIYSHVQSSKEVILLDTRDARDYLNWFKISTNGHFNNGWGELSFEAKFFPTLLLPSLSSTLWRTQYVCDIASDRHIDHWLRSPYLKRQEAARIEIELGFSIRDCSAFQTPQEIRSCRETFELYIYQTDDEEKEFQWSSYQLVDIIAGNRFTSNHYGSLTTSQTNNLTVNVKTRGISIDKNGFYIAFRDQGACVSILYVKIFYRLCEEINRGLVYFSSTPTGAYLTDIIEREGVCAINSKMIRKPLGFCKGNGQWTFQETLLRDSCHCQEGYELLIDHHHHHYHHHSHPHLSQSSSSSSTQSQQQQHNATTIPSRAICRVCPIGTFKSTISNEHRCEQCPANSYTEHRGATYCRCQTGFFRPNTTLIHSPCIAYPREPENITIDELDQASVKISWGRSLGTVYHLECFHSTPCESYIIYQPSQRSIENNSVRIVGLDSDTNYHMKIYAEQISTRMLSDSVDLSFTTEPGIAASIQDIHVRRISFSQVEITWSLDAFDQFHFRYWSLTDPMNKILVRLTSNNYTLVTTHEYYRFQIRGHNEQGWTNYTRDQLLSLPSLFIDEYHSTALHQRLIDKKRILFFGPFTLLGSLITVVILVLIYTRKRRFCRLKTGSDCESLDYQKRQVNGHYGPDAFFNSTWTSPLWPPVPSSTKTYIDPHTYEDPTKAVMEFTRELDPTLIVIESVIGGGEFGDVCRGTLSQIDASSSTDRPVAIKTLKPGATEKIRLDFLSEASIMGQFHHENVIYLEGVVTKHHPIMIVTEYMENGSLDAFLRANEGNARLDVLQLVSMLRGIASGMKYLSDMKYIHRDLAARNILINQDLVCKVADFGLSREISDDDSYTTKGGKIPIRWTAIEAIDYRKFTSASDVWSFGILCWEVISFGERPYWNWSNQDVIRAIKNAYRLPPPMNCPEVLYQLMLNCWKEQHLERPKFHDIFQQLTDFIQHPTELIPLARHKSIFVNDPDQPNVAQITTVSDWLDTLQLSHLTSFFIHAGYKNLSQICHMNASILLAVTDQKITRDEQTLLLENLKHLRSQLVLSSSKQLLVEDGLMV